MKTEIPAAYAANETLASAYRKGYNTGHGIACHNVPEMGADVLSDNLGRVTVDADNIREIHEDACFASEQNGRDFSPFEFTAKEFNDLGEGSDSEPSADDAWEAYDEGVADAIRADLATYTDEDYGIEKGKPLSELTSAGFTGTDASLAISLDEYGMAWAEEETSWHFCFKQANERFVRGFRFAKDLDFKKEFNWADWDAFLSFAGQTWEQWSGASVPQRIFDLVGFYGTEEIIGSSYHEGFKIDFEN